MRAYALLPLLLLAGCDAGPRDAPAATLRVDVVGDPGDPAGAPQRLLRAATQTGLTASDGLGRIVPGLASSWRIASDGRSVIFRLRNATWPDGRPVTAADVVAHLRRVLAPASTNRLKPLLTMIDNAAAVGAGTLPAQRLGIAAPVANVVEVRLSGAAPELLPLLAEPELALVRGGAHPPQLGAFTLADPAARPVRLVRNPAYHDAAGVTLGGLTVQADADPGAAVARFAHDRTDLVLGGGLAGLSDARLLGPTALHVEPAWGVYGYLANVRRGPLGDSRVRRALAMTAPRDGLAQRLFGVAAMVPATGPLPPGVGGSSGSGAPDWAGLDLAGRADAARALLAAAGFAADQPLTLTIALPPGREHAAVAAAVIANWAVVGVRATARPLDDAAFRQALKSGDFDLALTEHTVPVDTAMAFLAGFRCGASPGGYCNPAADALLDNAARDPAALGAAEAAITADTPLIALFVPVRWALVQPRVTGWTDTITGRHPLAALGLTARARR